VKKLTLKGRHLAPACRNARAPLPSFQEVTLDAQFSKFFKNNEFSCR